MSYLIDFHWAWLFFALILGVVIGWWTYRRPPTRFMDGRVWIVAACLALAAIVAISTIVHGTAGYWLELAVLMTIFYVIGCPFGWALRHLTLHEHAATPGTGTLLPNPGYTFRGAVLGGPVARATPGTVTPASPSAISPQPVAASPITDRPSPTPVPIDGATSPAPPVAPPAHQPVEAKPVATAPGTSPATPTSVPTAPGTTSAPPATIATQGPASDVSETPTPIAPTGIRVPVDPSPEPAESPSPLQAPHTGATPRSSEAQPGSTAPGPAASASPSPPKMPPVPNEDRHPGSRPDGLMTARDDKADDLKWIKGIGPQNEGRLHGLGIWHFDQIAAWTPDNVKWVGSYLAFHGRIDREKWIDQAKVLAGGAETAFAKRVVAGKVTTSHDDGSHGQKNIETSVKQRPRKR